MYHVIGEKRAVIVCVIDEFCVREMLICFFFLFLITQFQISSVAHLFLERDDLPPGSSAR